MEHDLYCKAGNVLHRHVVTLFFALAEDSDEIALGRLAAKRG